MIDLLSGWSPHKIFEEHVREPYIRVEEERKSHIDSARVMLIQV